MNYLKNENVIEIKDEIDGIPVIVLKPKNIDKNIATIIFYHGWSSSKDSQRFRGYILASYGYQVILPDAIHHGDRGILEYNAVNASKYFWKIVVNNIEESDKIIKAAIEKHNADPNRIGLIGHSMGAITSAGVFAKNDSISTLVTMNGSCSWTKTNELMAQGFNNANWHKLEIARDLSKYDPNNFHDKLINRPILLLHGGADVLVSPEPDRQFVEDIRNGYDDKENIDIIEFERLGHFVTTNMLEEGLKWFKKHL